jgi:hypothetical protein
MPGAGIWTLRSTCPAGEGERRFYIKRILMLLAVAALMVMMEMAMVAPAFADPPDKGPTGCGVGLGAFADPPGVAAFSRQNKGNHPFGEKNPSPFIKRFYEQFYNRA